MFVVFDYMMTTSYGWIAEITKVSDYRGFTVQWMYTPLYKHVITWERWNSVLKCFLCSTDAANSIATLNLGCVI